MGWVAKYSQRSFGGIWTVWNSNNLKMINSKIKKFSIFVVLEDLAFSKRFSLMCMIPLKI